MLANERVITIADSLPIGETRTRWTRPARGLLARQVTAIVGWPAARTRSTTSSASEVDPEREMMTTTWRPGFPGARTPPGRSISSDNGAAIASLPVVSRSTAAATWAR